MGCAASTASVDLSDNASKLPDQAKSDSVAAVPVVAEPPKDQSAETAEKADESSSNLANTQTTDEKSDHPKSASSSPTESKEYDLFLSHYQKTGGHLAEAIKLQLEKLNPKLQIFLDVDDLENTHDLDANVKNSKNFALLLTEGVLGRPFCRQEITTAVRAQKNLILIWDKDTTPFPSQDEISQCPPEVAEILKVKAVLYIKESCYRNVAIQEIHNKLKDAPELVSFSVHIPPTFAPESPIDFTWTAPKTFVKGWIGLYPLSPGESIQEFLDGKVAKGTQNVSLCWDWVGGGSTKGVLRKIAQKGCVVGLKYCAVFFNGDKYDFVATSSESTCQEYSVISQLNESSKKIHVEWWAPPTFKKGWIGVYPAFQEELGGSAKWFWAETTRGSYDLQWDWDGKSALQPNMQYQLRFFVGEGYDIVARSTEFQIPEDS